jgi:aspartyl-tRNA(Asn)/glutamyl-tRNA(Gln) amidotransferase subunit A
MAASPVTRPLHELSALELAAEIHAGTVSPVEAVKAALARIDEVDGKVKAFSYLDRETALIAAGEAEADIRAGRIKSPLHGVPFGIKEQFTLAGAPTLGDWADPNPPIAEHDATCVARLKDAGAIILGKLYMVGPSGTPPTRNPWNLGHTPGGSSSGSGAAVGARMLPFAMSEQTGGSGIRPAAYNGVSGLKPTYGRISRYGMFQMAWSHDHACIIGQTLRDVAAVFNVTAGYDPRDPTSRVEPLDPPVDPAAVSPPRIGVVRNFFPDLTEPVMQDAIEASAAKLKAAGADVADCYLPEEFALAWPSWMVAGGGEGATINAKADAARAAAGGRMRANPGGPKPASKFSNLPRELGAFIPATYYLQAQRIRRYLSEKVAPLFADYDALLVATAPGPAPKGLQSSGDWSLLLPWTHLGNPAVSIPGGLSPEGLPLGLQLVGPMLGDQRLLAVGSWCEDVIGRLGMPPLTGGDE